MQQTRQTPTFNMKAVVQETGLKPDTLRAWERRYGLPDPERTEGGHRLYSRRDIDTLKWLVDRQDEGLSISHAVELWNRLEAQGQDPLLVESPTSRPVESAVTPTITSGETMASLRQDWIGACMDFDERLAEQVLAQAFALYSPEQVVFEVLQKGLAQIGDGWYRGKTTVQQEHFASELANRRLEALVAATATPTRAGKILVGCPPGEEHTFVPLLLTLVLRRRGWDVIYLGANVPVDRLQPTIVATRPQLVVFPAQQLATAAALLDVAEVLRSENVPLAYGGRVFNLNPELRERIPGYFLGEDLDTAGRVVEQVLTTPQSPKAAIRAQADHEEALAHFLDRRAAVESAVWQRVRDLGTTYARLVNANQQMAKNIISALRLGEMSFLVTELGWLEGLTGHYDANDGTLPAYLNAYRSGLEQELDERGQLIKRWFTLLEQRPG